MVPLGNGLPAPWFQSTVLRTPKRPSFPLLEYPITTKIRRAQIPRRERAITAAAATRNPRHRALFQTVPNGVHARPIPPTPRQISQHARPRPSAHPAADKSCANKYHLVHTIHLLVLLCAPEKSIHTAATVRTYPLSCEPCAAPRDPCSRRAPGHVLEEHVVTGARGAHAKHRRGRTSPPSSADPGGRCPTRARPRQPDALTRHTRHTGARPWPRKHDRRPSRSADPCSRRAPGPVLEENVVTGARGAHAKHRRGRTSPPSSADPGGQCPTRARPRQPDALTRHTRHTGARPWSRKHDRRPSRSLPP